MTSIGPALGFVSGAAMLRFYVDFDKLSTGEESAGSFTLEGEDFLWVTGHLLEPGRY